MSSSYRYSLPGRFRVKALIDSSLDNLNNVPKLDSSGRISKTVLPTDAALLESGRIPASVLPTTAVVTDQDGRVPLARIPPRVITVDAAQPSYGDVCIFNGSSWTSKEDFDVYYLRAGTLGVERSDNWGLTIAPEPSVLFDDEGAHLDYTVAAGQAVTTVADSTCTFLRSQMLNAATPERPVRLEAEIILDSGVQTGGSFLSYAFGLVDDSAPHVTSADNVGGLAEGTTSTLGFCAIRMNSSLHSEFQAVFNSGGSATTVAVGRVPGQFIPAPNVPTTLCIEIAGENIVRYYVNNVLLHTQTATFSTNRRFSPFLFIKNLSASTRYAQVRKLRFIVPRGRASYSQGTVVKYDFNQDVQGQPASFVWRSGLGQLNVVASPNASVISGNVARPSSTSNSISSVFPMSKMRPTLPNYQLTWRRYFTNTGRDGFILRPTANPSTSTNPAGIYLGYLFMTHMSSATAITLRIYRVAEGATPVGTPLGTSSSLVATNISRFRATVQGSTLRFEYLDESVTPAVWRVGIERTDTSFASSSGLPIQYFAGFGQNQNNSYISDVTLTIL